MKGLCSLQATKSNSDITKSVDDHIIVPFCISGLARRTWALLFRYRIFPRDAKINAAVTCLTTATYSFMLKLKKKTRVSLCQRKRNSASIPASLGLKTQV